MSEVFSLYSTEIKMVTDKAWILEYLKGTVIMISNNSASCFELISYGGLGFIFLWWLLL